MPVIEDPSVQDVVRAHVHGLISEARPGDRLPAERELSERWGAARMTIRRVVDGFVADGLVERRPGSGTYVRRQPVVRSLGLTSFSEDMRERGLMPSSRLVEFTREFDVPKIAEQLNVDKRAAIVHISRLRLGSGEPIALEDIWIPETFVPGLTRADLAGSLYTVLYRRYGLAVDSATVLIEPTIPDARVSSLLGIDQSQACLRLRMTDVDSRGRVLMLAQCDYRGDKYRLTATVDRAPRLVARGRA
jgi:GntR family transcriptional regulator